MAYDPADGGSWFGTQSDGGSARTLYQFSPAGRALGIAQYADWEADNFLVGEFAEAAIFV